MNKLQKKAVLIGASVCVAMGLCPPWRASLDLPVHIRYERTEYALIWDSPRPSASDLQYGDPSLAPSALTASGEPPTSGPLGDKPTPEDPIRAVQRYHEQRAQQEAQRTQQKLNQRVYVRIDLTRLAVQWAIVAIATAGVVVFLSGPKPFHQLQ